MIAYTIRLYNQFKRPYGMVSDNDQCVNTELSEYTTTKYDTAIKIINDFLDVPLAELTLDGIKEQYADFLDDNIKEQNLVYIQKYYNGRLAISKDVIKYIDEGIETLKKHKKEILKEEFNIPYEYNHYMLYSETVSSYKEEQIKAYISIMMEDVDDLSEYEKA